MAILLNKRTQTEFDISAPVLTFSDTGAGAQQPSDAIVDYNGFATLTAVAKAINPSTDTEASGTISYQWYKDGTLMVGETSSNLYLSNQLLGADYYCVASFIPAAGTAPAINSPLTSDTATTTIKIYIEILQQPTYTKITEGKNASFSIAAVASNGDNASLRYEWFFNNSLISTTIGGTLSTVNVIAPSPPGLYSIYCKVSQGGVPNATAAPAVNSVTVNLESSPKPAVQCLQWDDQIKPCAKNETIKTTSGLKPGPVSVWYGPWEWGTDNDTCYVYFKIRINRIHPRAGFGDGQQPFTMFFQCRLRGQGGDIYNAYKVLEWNGTTGNTNDYKDLEFGPGDFNGQVVRSFKSDGSVNFERTNTQGQYLSGWDGTRLKWPSGSGKPKLDILLLSVNRKSDGNSLPSGAFPEVTESVNNNILECGRTYDPNTENPLNQTAAFNTNTPIIQLTHQKGKKASYNRSEVYNITLKRYADTTNSNGVYGDGNPPTGSDAVNIGVGQWEFFAPRDMWVALEMAGAGGQGARNFKSNQLYPGGKGGGSIINFKMKKNVVYTLCVGRRGFTYTTGNLSTFENEISPGGGRPGSEQNDNEGAGGGGTFLYEGGRLIAACGGGGGAGRGAKYDNGSYGDDGVGRIGGNGGGCNLGGTAGDGSFGGTGATTSGPGNCKDTNLYNRTTRSLNRDNWMGDGECGSWIPGQDPGACPCMYSNATNRTYSDETNPKRILSDDSITTALAQSCDKPATSKVSSSPISVSQVSEIIISSNPPAELILPAE